MRKISLIVSCLTLTIIIVWYLIHRQEGERQPIDSPIKGASDNVDEPRANKIGAGTHNHVSEIKSRAPTDRSPNSAATLEEIVTKLESHLGEGDIGYILGDLPDEIPPALQARIDAAIKKHDRLTFFQKLEYLEKSLTSNQFDHDTLRGILTPPEDATEAEKERIRGDAFMAIEILGKRLADQIAQSEHEAITSITASSLMDAFSMLSRVSHSNDYDFFLQFFLKSRDRDIDEHGKDIDLTVSALRHMVEIDKEKAKIWVTNILTADNDYGREFRTSALSIVEKHYRTDEFIPAIKEVIALYPHPPEMAYRDTGKTYTIGGRDSLQEIAKKFYGNAGFTIVLEEANKDKLNKHPMQWPGTIICIPDLTEETKRGMTLTEYNALYRAIIDALRAIGSETAEKLISEIESREPSRRR